MRKPSEETEKILPELVKKLRERAMTLDEIRAFTGWNTYSCVMTHIDSIGDHYPIFSPAKNQYKILTDDDYVTYA